MVTARPARQADDTARARPEGWQRELARGEHTVEPARDIDLAELVSECAEIAETHARTKLVTVERLKYNDSPILAGRNPRLEIPPVAFSDGPRGVIMHHSTCFPVAMARGASWDLDLERRVGDAIG